MEEMLISEFKAHCIAEIKNLHRTGRALTITLRGKPIAQVVTLLVKDEPAVKLGSRPGDAVITRDLAQMDFADEWEINQSISVLIPVSGFGQPKRRIARSEDAQMIGAFPDADKPRLEIFRHSRQICGTSGGYPASRALGAHRREVQRKAR